MTKEFIIPKRIRMEDMRYLRALPGYKNWYFYKRHKGKIIKKNTYCPVDPKPWDNMTPHESKLKAYGIALRLVSALEGAKRQDDIRAIFDSIATVTGIQEEVALKVGDWIAQRIAVYVKQGRLSESGERNYRDAARKLEDYLGARYDGRLDSITRQDAEGYKLFLMDRLKHSTANSMLGLTARFFKDAQDLDKISKSPFNGIGAVSTPLAERSRSAAKRAFTVDEIEQILSQCEKDGADEWYSMVLLAYYGGGQRLSDIAQLRWDMIDFDVRKVSFCSQKSKYPISNPLTDVLDDHLQEHRKMVEGDHVHPHAADLYSRGRSSQVSNEFGHILYDCGLIPTDPMEGGKRKMLRDKKAAEEMGISYEEYKAQNRKRKMNEVGFHSFRATAITIFKENNVGDTLSMAIAGHTDQGVHSKYGIGIRDEAKREVLNAMPDVGKFRKCSKK